MESKKTFGAYILRRRKELGMTQKEFAQKLFVTESAVSKWERGLSYPDITLIQTICSVLEISEHELLTGSEDTKMRTSEKFAAKYFRLTRNYRWSQYLLYGLILLGCGIGNLAANHCLDWFFIVLAAVFMSASVTLLPALAALHPKGGRYKVHLAFGSFTLCLELLLLVVCVYSGGSWFPIAGISVLFGLTLVCLPFLLPTMPLPAVFVRRKASLYFLTEIVLLLLLLLIVCVSEQGDWFPLAAVSVLCGLGFLILPVFLCQASLPDPLQKHKVLMYFFIQTGLVILVVLFSAGSLEDFLFQGLPVTLLTAVLPWGIMLSIRYIPGNLFFKFAGACETVSLWVWLFPVLFDRLYGYAEDPNYNSYPLWPFTHFSNVQIGNQLAYQMISIVILGFFGLAVVFVLLGLRKLQKKKEEKEGVR